MKGVFFGPDFISVTKDESIEWQVANLYFNNKIEIPVLLFYLKKLLKPRIFSTIMDFYASGKDIVTEKKINDYDIQDDDSEVL